MGKSKSSTQVEAKPDLHDQLQPGIPAVKTKAVKAKAKAKDASKDQGKAVAPDAVKVKEKVKEKDKSKPKAKAKTKSKPKAKTKVKAKDKDKDKSAAIATDFPPLAPAPSKPGKLVRDSFTMPSEDFALIAQLKERALEFRRPTKKSELLRAGLQILAGLEKSDLQEALEQLRPLKVGRPKNPR